MPHNALDELAPCSLTDLSTYWQAIPSVDPCWSDPSPEPYLSIPVNFGSNTPPSGTPASGVVGSVLPLRRAEELIATLPGVLSVRIVPSLTGDVDEIHVLATSEVVPKNMVRNIESALMAQLGLRVNHRKVSIAQSLDPARAADTPSLAAPTPAPVISQIPASGNPVASPPQGTAIPGVASAAYVPYQPPAPVMAQPASAPSAAAETRSVGRRVMIFEDVEVRRSRTRGVLCKVTLSRGGEEFIGEAEGQESERSRIDLAARATVAAILESQKATASGSDRSLALEGAKAIEAFDRDFIFVSVVGRIGRESAVLTGSCEVKESPETSAVLAVLDATNRWIHLDR